MFTSFSCPETSEHFVFFLAQGGRLNDLRLIVYYLSYKCIIGRNLTLNILDYFTGDWKMYKSFCIFSVLCIVLLFISPTLLSSIFSLSPSYNTLGLTVRVMMYFTAFSVGDSHKMTVCQELLFLRET